jgi:hypothetical protein
MPPVVVELVIDKETKNTVRFVEDSDTPEVGMIYVPKATWMRQGSPHAHPPLRRARGRACRRGVTRKGAQRPRARTVSTLHPSGPSGEVMPLMERYGLHPRRWAAYARLRTSRAS